MHCGVTKGPQGHKEQVTRLKGFPFRAHNGNCGGSWACICIVAVREGTQGKTPREPLIGTESPPQPSGGWEGRFTPFISSSPHPSLCGAELLSFEEAFQLGRLLEVYTSYSFLEEAEVQKTWVLGLALPPTSCVSRGQLLSALALGLGFHIWGEIFSYHHIPLPGTPPRAET